MEIDQGTDGKLEMLGLLTCECGGSALSTASSDVVVSSASDVLF